MPGVNREQQRHGRDRRRAARSRSRSGHDLPQARERRAARSQDASVPAAERVVGSSDYARAIGSGREQWRGVRHQRSDPPALAGRDADRKEVFQSALAQAEELWDAAAVAGPASRPLPLFYCVSQAGRAVCAAWTTADEWRPRYHGLKRRESRATAPEDRVLDYAAAVTSQALAIYAMVAEATGSSSFEGFATVADLWTSLPGWPTPNDLFGENRPRCLTLEPVRLQGDPRPLVEQLVRPTHVALRSAAKLDVDELPAVYPTMTGIQQDGTRTNVFGGHDPLYTFIGDDGRPVPLYEIGERAPGSRVLSGDLIVRPHVGDMAIGPPSDFLTLWALLFCLSELARYYPDTWVQALNPDCSHAAVTLEHGLDLALERTPSLINGALHGPIAQLIREEVRRLEAEAGGAVEDAPTTEGPTAEP